MSGAAENAATPVARINENKRDNKGFLPVTIKNPNENQKTNWNCITLQPLPCAASAATALHPYSPGHAHRPPNPGTSIPDDGFLCAR